MNTIIKVAQIVARLANNCFEIAEDGKVTIADFPEVVLLLNELAELVGVDKMAVLDELDNMTHDDVDLVVSKFDDAFTAMDKSAKKDIVIDLIRVSLDLVHCIDSLYGSIKNLKG